MPRPEWALTWRAALGALVIVAAFCAQQASCMFSGSAVGDKEALLAVQQVLQAQESLNWDLAGDHCSFSGVVCDNSTRRVVGIDLSGRGLQGQIPWQLTALTELEYLNLANNRLGAGALAQLASLNKLAVLALHNNNIHGAIPCSLGSMMELRTLSLSDNRLNGSIPLSFGLDQQAKLASLYLDGNELHSAVQPWLLDLPHLSELMLTKAGVRASVLTSQDREMFIQLDGNAGLECAGIDESADQCIGTCGAAPAPPQPASRFVARAVTNDGLGALLSVDDSDAVANASFRMTPGMGGVTETGAAILLDAIPAMLPLPPLSCAESTPNAGAADPDCMPAFGLSFWFWGAPGAGLRLSISAGQGWPEMTLEPLESLSDSFGADSSVGALPHANAQEWTLFTLTAGSTASGYNLSIFLNHQEVPLETDAAMNAAWGHSGGALLLSSNSSAELAVADVQAWDHALTPSDITAVIEEKIADVRRTPPQPTLVATLNSSATTVEFLPSWWTAGATYMWQAGNACGSQTVVQMRTTPYPYPATSSAPVLLASQSQQPWHHNAQVAAVAYGVLGGRTVTSHMPKFPAMLAMERVHGLHSVQAVEVQDRVFLFARFSEQATRDPRYSATAQAGGMPILLPQPHSVPAFGRMRSAPLLVSDLTSHDAEIQVTPWLGHVPGHSAAVSREQGLARAAHLQLLDAQIHGTHLLLIVNVTVPGFDNDSILRQELLNDCQVAVLNRTLTDAMDFVGAVWLDEWSAGVYEHMDEEDGLWHVNISTLASTITFDGVALAVPERQQQQPFVAYYPGAVQAHVIVPVQVNFEAPTIQRLLPTSDESLAVWLNHTAIAGSHVGEAMAVVRVCTMDPASGQPACGGTLTFPLQVEAGSDVALVDLHGIPMTLDVTLSIAVQTGSLRSEPVTVEAVTPESLMAPIVQPLAVLPLVAVGELLFIMDEPFPAAHVAVAARACGTTSNAPCSVDFMPPEALTVLPVEYLGRRVTAVRLVGWQQAPEHFFLSAHRLLVDGRFSMPGAPALVQREALLGNEETLVLFPSAPASTELRAIHPVTPPGARVVAVSCTADLHCSITAPKHVVSIPAAQHLTVSQFGRVEGASLFALLTFTVSGVRTLGTQVSPVFPQQSAAVVSAAVATEFERTVAVADPVLEAGHGAYYLLEWCSEEACAVPMGIDLLRPQDQRYSAASPSTVSFTFRHLPSGSPVHLRVRSLSGAPGDDTWLAVASHGGAGLFSPAEQVYPPPRMEMLDVVWLQHSDGPVLEARVVPLPQTEETQVHSVEFELCETQACAAPVFSFTSDFQAVNTTLPWAAYSIPGVPDTGRFIRATALGRAGAGPTSAAQRVRSLTPAATTATVFPQARLARQAGFRRALLVSVAAHLPFPSSFMCVDLCYDAGCALPKASHCMPVSAAAEVDSALELGPVESVYARLFLRGESSQTALGEPLFSPGLAVRLTGARFQDTGAAVNVWVETALPGSASLTPPGTAVGCCTLFTSDTCTSLGLGATCAMDAEGTTMVARMGLQPTIRPNDVLQLRDTLAFQAAVVSLPPVDPVRPQAVIVAPARIGVCDRLTLDGSLSTGGAGRPMQLRWSVVSVAPNATELAEFLASLPLTTRRVELEVEQLQPGHQYTFTLLAVNYLSHNGTTATVTIQKGNMPLPQVFIAGQPTLTITRDRALQFSADASMPACGTYQNVGLDFQWVWDAALPSAAFTTRNPRVLSIAPRTLHVGKTYNFTVLVSVRGAAAVRNSAAVWVTVAAGPVVATIAGGDRVAGVEQELQLDASPSRDTDYADTELQFSWACADSESGHPCLNALDQPLLANVATGAAKLTIKAGELRPNSVPRFTATVSKQQGDATVSAQAAVRVTVRPGNPPRVSIVSAPRVANAEDRIRLEAVVQSAAPATVQTSWQVRLGSTLLPAASLFSTPLNALRASLLPRALGAGNTYEFVLRATDSSGEGFAAASVRINAPPFAGYVDVTPKTGVASQTTYELTASDWTDDPDDLPLTYIFGYVSGTPNAAQLQPSDVIRIGSSFASRTNARAVLPRGLGEGSKVTVVVLVRDALGAVAVSGRDQQGAWAQATVNALVIQAQQAAALASSAAQSLTDLLSLGDSDAAMSMMSTLAATLSNPCDGVQCGEHGQCVSGACQCTNGYRGRTCETPPATDGGYSAWSEWSGCSHSCGGGLRTRTRTCTNPRPQFGGRDCSALGPATQSMSCNEAPCETVVHGGYSDWTEWSACSATCQPGRGGTSPGVQSRYRTCTNPTPSRSGRNCVGPASQTRACNTDRCPSPIKACPGSSYNAGFTAFVSQCSGHGSCERSTPRCASDDRACTVTCRCSEGWAGQDCGRTEAQRQASQLFRESALGSLVQSMAMTDASAAGVNMQANTLRDVTSVADELTETAAAVAMTATSNLLASADSLGSSLDAAVGGAVLSVVSSVASSRSMRNGAARRLLSAASTDIVHTVGGLLVKDNLPGEGAVTVSASGVDLAVQKHDPGELGSTSLSFDAGSSVAFPAGLDLSGSADSEGVNVMLMAWADALAPTGDGQQDVLSSVISIEVSSAADGETVAVQDLEVPVVFRVPFLDGGSSTCGYLGPDGWTTKGVIATRVVVEDGQSFLVCAAVHLSDFAAFSKDSVPTMNLVNPVADASMLLNYNVSNMLPAVVLACVVAAYLAAWAVSLRLDRAARTRRLRARLGQFLHKGSLDPAEVAFDPRDPTNVQSAEAPRGWGMRNIAARFKAFVRKDHALVSIVAPHMSETITLTRAQRVLIMLAQALTGFAANALFFGNDPGRYDTWILTALISMLVMAPPSLLLPLAFRKANSFSSLTISKRRREKLARLRRALAFSKRFSLLSRSALGRSNRVEPEMKLENDGPAQHAEEKPQLPLGDAVQSIMISPRADDASPRSQSKIKRVALVGSIQRKIRILEEQRQEIQQRRAQLAARSGQARALPSRGVTSARFDNGTSTPTGESSASSGSGNGSRAVAATTMQKQRELADREDFIEAEIRTLRRMLHQRYVMVATGFVLAVVGIVQLAVGAYQGLTNVYVGTFAGVLMVPAILSALAGGFTLHAASKPTWRRATTIISLCILFMVAALAMLVIVYAGHASGRMYDRAINTMRSGWEDAYKRGTEQNRTSLLTSLEDFQAEHNCCGYLNPQDLPVGQCADTVAANVTVAELAPGCAHAVLRTAQQAVAPLFSLISVQGVAAIALVIVAWQRRRDVQIRHNSAVQAVVEKYKQPTPEEHIAATAIQRAYRGMAGRKRAVRKLEYNAWLDMRRERQVILFALHVSVFLYIFFALYINLLYGVYFDEKMAEAWVLASLTAMALDLFLQQPLMIMFKSVGFTLLANVVQIADYGVLAA